MMSPGPMSRTFWPGCACSTAPNLAVSTTSISPRMSGAVLSIAVASPVRYQDRKV
jgi:hypothetical protein